MKGGPSSCPLKFNFEFEPSMKLMSGRRAFSSAVKVKG